MTRPSSDPPVLRVVGAAIIRHRRCLATQRSEHMAEPGRWEFPGGKIEPGEQPRQALKREIREELELEINVGPWLGRGQSVVDGRRIKLDVYLASSTTGRLQLNEHSKHGWFQADDLHHLDWALADIPIVPRLVEYLISGKVSADLDDS